eukprot:scaffold196267_cov32-Tisochrysis_lutea.AAC.9
MEARPWTCPPSSRVPFRAPRLEHHRGAFPNAPAGTVPKMGRSVVSGGGFSSARRSYSVNMYPEFDDPSMPVTQVRTS